MRALGDVDDVQDAVDLPVTTAIKSVATGRVVPFPGGRGHGRRAAPARELCFGGEACGIADLGE